MATKKRKVGFTFGTTAVDVSKEIVIDAMFLTTDLLHSIRNQLPIELSTAQLVEHKPVEAPPARRLRSRRGGWVLLGVAVLSLVLIGAWGVQSAMESRDRDRAALGAKSLLHSVHGAIDVNSDAFVVEAAQSMTSKPGAVIELLQPRWDSGRRSEVEMALLAESLLRTGEFEKARSLALEGLETAPESTGLSSVYNKSFLEDPEFSTAFESLSLDDATMLNDDGEFAPIVEIDGVAWDLVLSTQDEPARWQAAVAEYRLCRVLNCSFGYAEARPVQVRWDELEVELFEDEELLSHLNRDGDVVQAALVQRVESEARFPIERSRAWRRILDVQRELKPVALKKAFSSWKRKNPKALKAMKRHMGDVDSADVGQQLSSMVLFDYLVGNYGRFERGRKNYGENVRMVDNKLWAAAGGVAMGMRPSKRARGRLLWVERFSKSNVAGARALDITTLSTVIFPGATKAEAKQVKLIGSQLEKLRAHILKLEQEHGTAAVLPFS